jgi:ribosomal protein S12 methylthiotransferase accessory factor
MIVSFPGGKRVDVDVGGFVIRTDQPRDAGGEGSAPEPFTTFLASLGACAGLYVLGFCQARGISTAGLRLMLQHERDPQTKRLTRVRIDIELPADFPPQYVAAARNTASHCAVKRVIAEPPEFVIEAQIARPEVRA